MATEGVTFRDIRTIAELADGIRMDGWEAGDPNNPLITPLKEMADDIATWFNPDQNWRLTQVRTGFVNLKRIEQSSVQEVGPHEGVPHPIFRTKIEEPDKFTPTFFFESDKPPLENKGWFRKGELVLHRVFSSEFGGRIIWGWNLNSADVFPDHKVGSVYPLEQALQELSSPYFLRVARLTVSRGAAAVVPNHGLTIMVFMYNLVDYTRLEAKRLRGEANKMNGARRRLERKFPPDYTNLLR